MQAEFLNFDDHILRGVMGRHETFTPRYGWLKKGYEATIKDGYFYKAPDAIEQLGVGKNMVSSIRYWSQAFKMIEPDNKGYLHPTDLGNRLLNNNGWDPYLEDVSSLWLLHWHLFIPHLEAVNWSFAFNKCNLWDFDIKQLSRIIFSAAQKYQRFSSVSEKTFERDASCLIRMYLDEPSDKDSEIDCPFTQLGIIRKAEEKNTVSFDTSDKQNLPALIFASACFSYMSSYVPSSQKTISLYRLTYDFNSPGVVFKVTETSAGNYLNDAVKILGKGFFLDDSTGSMQLHFDEEPGALYWYALEKYYNGDN